jgi:phage gp46-like protein
MIYDQTATIVVDGRTRSLGMTPEDPLVRAVIISLFTWRRAHPDDVTEGRKMGWWGDTTSAVTNDRIGSRLWLLAREKVLPATINRAREYARESLEWLIEDGLASRVEVTAERRGTDGIALSATIYRSDGRPLVLRFDDLWETVRHAV